MPELRLLRLRDVSVIDELARELAKEDGSERYYKAYSGLAQQHFIVEHLGVRKGFLSLSPTPDPPSSAVRPFGTTELNRLLVFHRWRRQGVAGKIFRLLARQSDGIHSKVMADNETAIACYLKYGWTLNALTLIKDKMLAEITLAGDPGGGPSRDNDEIRRLERKGWVRHYYAVSLPSPKEGSASV